MRISDWSSDVCSSDLCGVFKGGGGPKTPTVGDRVSILSNDASIKVDPALAETAVVLPAAVANADWAQSGGNASKSMGHLALAASRSQTWSAGIAGSTKTPPLGAAPVGADKLGSVPGWASVVQHCQLSEAPRALAKQTLDPTA